MEGDKLSSDIEPVEESEENSKTILGAQATGGGLTGARGATPIPAVSNQTVSPKWEGVVSPGSTMIGMAMWRCRASSEVGSAAAGKKLVIRVCWRSCTAVIDGGMRS
jgi:hypothetical protein